MIYLDNAATTIHKPDCVRQAVMEALDSFGNSSRGTHGGALMASRMIYDTRVRVSELFTCSPDHVIFTANSTEALNIAIHGLFSSEDHIITTDLEHNSVLRPLNRLEDAGAALSFVPADAKGLIQYEDFESLIRPDTRGIVCTHASNLTGNLIDLARVGAIAKRHGILFVVDASQTAGIYPVDMAAYGIDVLCFTGHKGLYGPQGTGGLCIRRGLKLKSWKEGGSGIRSFDRRQPEVYPTLLEAGTLNGHGLAGLHAALGWIRETGIDTVRRREQELAEKFYESVRFIPGIRIYGDFSSSDRAPVIALNLGDYPSSEVADELDQRFEIAVRAGAHCAPRMHRALGTEEQGAVRFSFSWFNTEKEVLAAAEALCILAQEE